MYLKNKYLVIPVDTMATHAVWDQVRDKIEDSIFDIEMAIKIWVLNDV